MVFLWLFLNWGGGARNTTPKKIKKQKKSANEFSSATSNNTIGWYKIVNAHTYFTVLVLSSTTLRCFSSGIPCNELLVLFNFVASFLEIMKKLLDILHVEFTIAKTMFLFCFWCVITTWVSWRTWRRMSAKRKKL